MKFKNRSQIFGVRILLIFLAGISVSTVGCSQDQLQAPVSQTQGSTHTQRISEGVIGLVTSRDGAVITGAMIVPTPRFRNSPPIPEIAITTDSEGRYQWPLPPGSYQITVISNGFTKQALNVEVKKNRLSKLNFVMDQHP
jgi:hypothetical protein